MYSVWVSWHDMSCIFLDAEVPCHVTFFSQALYRWHGTYAFFCFFHFADDMGVCVFWVCPTTPMSSASTIIHGFSQWRLIYGGFLSHEGVSKSSSRHGWPWLCIETYGALGIPPSKIWRNLHDVIMRNSLSENIVIIYLAFESLMIIVNWICPKIIYHDWEIMIWSI